MKYAEDRPFEIDTILSKLKTMVWIRRIIIVFCKTYFDGATTVTTIDFFYTSIVTICGIFLSIKNGYKNYKHFWIVFNNLLNFLHISSKTCIELERFVAS